MIIEFFQDASLFTCILLTLVIFIMSVFPIPGLGVVSTVVAFLIQNMIKSFIVLFLGQMIAAVLCMVIIRKYLKEQFLAQFANTAIFRVLEMECRHHPWISSIASNIILVPACTKNYVLPLTSMTLAQYYGPKIPFYIFFSYLYAELGTQLNGLRDLDVERSFTKLTLAQKI